VVLVGKRHACVVVVAAHFGVTVMHDHAGDQFVVRVWERLEDVVPVLADLVVEVVQHQFLSCAEYVFGREREA
jgi:hypothetical protein